MEAIGIGVVGTGDWGANLVRNFAGLPGARLVAVCDADAKRLAQTTAKYPDAQGFDHPPVHDPCARALAALEACQRRRSRHEAELACRAPGSA